MRAKEMLRCSNWESCKRTTMHKTGKCIECRKTKCRAMGCERKFFSCGKWDLCDMHRRRIQARQETQWSVAV